MVRIYRFFSYYTHIPILSKSIYINVSPFASLTYSHFSTSPFLNTCPFLSSISLQKELPLHN